VQIKFDIPGMPMVFIGNSDYNAMKTHKTSGIIDHPDQSVTTEKIADRAVTKDKVADGTVGISNLDADLTELLNSFANENSVSNQFDTLSQEVAAKVDKENGKGLSTNDFTDDLKEKLDLLPDANSLSQNLKDVSDGLNDLNNFSKNNFANSLKASVTGEIIQVDDVSPIEHIVSLNVNLENATETVENPKLYVCGKNLLNFADTNGDVQGTYRGWLVNPTKQKITMTILDRDTNVDISGIYLGICNTGIDGTGGIAWLVEKGEIKRTLYSINRKYISVFRSGTLSFEEAIEKLTQRFYIQVEYGTEATSYEDFKGGKYDISESEMNIPSLASSAMNVYSNVPGALIECEYNQDTNAVIGKLINAVISLGGNV
jgi:hypothetical protein